MAERFKAPVLKTGRGRELPREFESHPFRHPVTARAKAASLGQLSAAVRAIEAKAKISGLLTQKPEIPIEEATPGIEEWAPLRPCAN